MWWWKFLNGLCRYGYKFVEKAEKSTSSIESFNCKHDNSLSMYWKVLMLYCQGCGSFDVCLFFHNSWACPSCYIESANKPILKKGQVQNSAIEK